ncbi:MAG: dephospho-CoA kinase [Muribaculaceae bacterium]|nr:dephospho-CoA kinase [Muribaculaceae bacterium]
MTSNSRTLICISGGIGSGKSVVARIVASMGYAVYDTDLQAKRIMDESVEMHRKLSECFGHNIVRDGNIDRRALADIVFSDDDKLKKLNSIVHSAVIEDITKWRESLSDEIAFVETAILYQSGLDRLVDIVWEVTAPSEIRIERVMKRNSCSRAEVESRISAQRSENKHTHPKVAVIVNDNLSPLLPQILSLL